MPRSRRAGVGRTGAHALTIMFVTALPAAGHEVLARHTVSDDGAAIRVEFYFPDGSPAIDFAVTARTADGVEQSLGNTDTEGTIIFRPARRTEYTIRARQAGHGRDLVLPIRIVGPAYDRAEAADTAPRPPAPQFGPPTREASPYPLAEVLASIGFVAVLSLITLALMRIAGRRADEAADDRDALLRELADLRAEVQQLRQEADKS